MTIIIITKFNTLPVFFWKKITKLQTAAVYANECRRWSILKIISFGWVPSVLFFFCFRAVSIRKLATCWQSNENNQMTSHFCIHFFARRHHLKYLFADKLQELTYWKILCASYANAYCNMCIHSLSYIFHHRDIDIT